MGYIHLMLTSKAVVSILGAVEQEESPALGPCPEVPERNGKFLLTLNTTLPSHTLKMGDLLSA